MVKSVQSYMASDGSLHATHEKAVIKEIGNMLFNSNNDEIPQFADHIVKHYTAFIQILDQLRPQPARKEPLTKDDYEKHGNGLK